MIILDTMKNIFNLKNKKRNHKSGFTVIEVLVACAIITSTSLILMSSASKGIELSNRALRQSQSSMLLEEGAEAVKSIRDTNWDLISALSSETDYYLSFDTTSNTWSLNTVPSPQIDEIFSRKIVLSDVYRDSNDDIAETGYLDEGFKRVVVTVDWQNKEELKSKDLTFYLSNIFN